MPSPFTPANPPPMPAFPNTYIKEAKGDSGPELKVSKYPDTFAESFTPDERILSKMQEYKPGDAGTESTIYSRLDPEGYDSLKGSVFINNVSYSGADIKVLIQTYDTDDSGTQKKIDDLLLLIEKTTKRIDKLRVDYNVIYMKYWATGEEIKIATPEEKRLRTRGNALKSEGKNLEAQLKTMNDDLKRLMKGVIKFPTQVLATCQTLSLSTFRDKQAVRACGSVYPKGFCRGPREIAGSLVFTVFDESVLYEFLRTHASDFDANTYTSAMMDQMPPVDILLSFANEYGQVSRMTIYGVEFVSDGQVMSIENILTENTVNFVARDMDPMRSVGSYVKNDEGSASLSRDWMGKKASDVLLEDEGYKRFKERRNPFL